MHNSILIIDDNPDDIELTKVVLEPQFDIQSADKASVGLEMAKSNKPDLVLLDIGMPDIDGFHVLQQLKDNPLTQSIPVIFLSGVVRESRELVALKLGAEEVLRKGISADLLKHRITTVLHHARLKNDRKGYTNKRKKITFLMKS